MQEHKVKKTGVIWGMVSACLLLIMSSGITQAATVSYTLDNVILDNLQQMTGTFEWTYVEGDFENGSGLFSELFIPGTSHTLDELRITFDIGKSIEFTLIDNLDSDGIDITLFLVRALTPTQSALIDLSRSRYSIGGGGTTGVFVSGSISPMVVPIPATVWLLGSGLLGLFGIARGKK